METFIIRNDRLTKQGVHPFDDPAQLGAHVSAMAGEGGLLDKGETLPEEPQGLVVNGFPFQGIGGINRRTVFFQLTGQPDFVQFTDGALVRDRPDGMDEMGEPVRQEDRRGQADKPGLEMGPAPGRMPGQAEGVRAGALQSAEFVSEVRQRPDNRVIQQISRSPSDSEWSATKRISP